MEQRPVLLLNGRTARNTSFTPRGLLSVLFRRRRVFWVTFLAVFLPIALAVLVLPGDYESETKVLVERQRSDPVISSSFSGQNNDSQAMAPLEEQDIDSEIDLLESQDLLHNLVIQHDLWSSVPWWRKFVPIPLGSKERRIAKAERAVRENLTIEPPNKSNIVTIRYHSKDPEEAESVLKAISQLYLAKHLEVHRPAGSTEFFEQEVARNRQAVQDAENKLNEFTKANGVVAADAEGNSTLEKMAVFDSTLQSTRAQITSTKQRIANLESQMRGVPKDITTRVKTSPVLMDNLKSTLYSLELKRSELLTKYQPGYRLVKDLDKQIADTRAAISNAEQTPTAERTTEQDPVYIWLNTELAKAKAELVALEASESQTRRTVTDYRSRAINLEGLGRVQQDLIRTEKAAEEAYVAAMRKQAEAKMSQALDRSRIMNISIAEPPTTPALPTTSPITKLVVGFCLALFIALGLVFVADYWDPSFRTPHEIETVLEVPVLAAIPHPKALRGKAYMIELPGKPTSWST